MSTIRLVKAAVAGHLICVLLIAREIEKEGKQRLGVLAVEPFKVKARRHRFHPQDAPRRKMYLKHFGLRQQS